LKFTFPAFNPECRASKRRFGFLAAHFAIPTAMLAAARADRVAVKVTEFGPKTGDRRPWIHP
jgi:hypothetical protein